MQNTWNPLLEKLSNQVDTLISESGKHSCRVAKLGKKVAQRLGVKGQELDVIYWGALLHDIGKIGIPQEIIQKKGPLSQSEWLLMELHPTIGANIVLATQSMGAVVSIIETHQERYDGQGYPIGFEGKDIPLGARILAVVDSFDAMTDERPYRKALDANAAIAELVRVRGSQLDPKVVDVFLDIVGGNSIC